MDVISAILTLLAPLVALVVLMLAARRRGRLGPVFLGLIALLAAAWGLSVAAQATDFRDADGWVDCWPGCSLLQEAVGTTFFYAPIYALALAIVATVLRVVDRRRK